MLSADTEGGAEVVSENGPDGASEGCSADDDQAEAEAEGEPPSARGLSSPSPDTNCQAPTPIPPTRTTASTANSTVPRCGLGGLRPGAGGSAPCPTQRWVCSSHRRPPSPPDVLISAAQQRADRLSDGDAGGEHADAGAGVL
ncbi:hypothetical protein GCM10009548_14760 [Streptomyces malaysiensis subsp. malaysiensis]